MNALSNVMDVGQTEAGVPRRFRKADIGLRRHTTEGAQLIDELVCDNYAVRGTRGRDCPTLANGCVSRPM